MSSTISSVRAARVEQGAHRPRNPAASTAYSERRGVLRRRSFPTTAIAIRPSVTSHKEPAVDAGQVDPAAADREEQRQQKDHHEVVDAAATSVVSPAFRGITGTKDEGSEDRCNACPLATQTPPGEHRQRSFRSRPGGSWPTSAYATAARPRNGLVSNSTMATTKSTVQPMIVSACKPLPLARDGECEREQAPGSHVVDRRRG